LGTRWGNTSIKNSTITSHPSPSQRRLKAEPSLV
jgi:hypothetical protein